jgi:signal transduction histidine kinase
MDTNLESKTAAYLTHELRAPLTSIQCALSLLQGETEALSAGAKQHLDICVRNAERLRGLIDDILDLSRIQAGRMHVLLMPCDAAELAREAADGLRPWAQKKGLALVVQCEDGCPPVSADRRRTVQVLMNLLSNAIKFTPEGGTITVRVEAGRRDDAGFVAFSVTDTGRGIALDDQSRIFRYFAQAGEGLKRGEGSGLGLALARSMVELQGGTIGVDSVPGKGSTFRFTLAAHIPAPEKEALAPARASGYLR